MGGTVEVRDLWERFRLYHTRPRGLKERLFRLERAVYQDYWALKGVDFTLEPGQSLAIIGANGSGKSTLLKCLAKILPPDRGSVQVTGTMASLLELGAGFHGDLTGRENIFLNGSILGLRRRDIQRNFDKIVDFSGVRDFIDTPVKNYSSGMYVRLGFAVAVNVDPDILLIDEILAVGDANFQSKCFETMHDFKRQGKTIILVTHDLDAAARLCDRVILLEKGEVIADGPSRSTIDTYRRLVQQEVAEEAAAAAEAAGDEPAPAHNPNRWGTGGAEIVQAQLLDANDRPVESVEVGAWCTFRLLVRFDKEVEEPIWGYIIRADDGVEVFNANTLWRGVPTGTYNAGDLAEVRFRQRMHVTPRRYLFTTAVAYRDGTKWYDWWDECLSFHVRGSLLDRGYANLEADIDFSVMTNPGGVRGAQASEASGSPPEWKSTSWAG